MGEREARALAEGLDQALREEVATKTDLSSGQERVSQPISRRSRPSSQSRLAAVKTELRTEIAAVETGSEPKSRCRDDLAAVKHDMLRWMVGMAFAQVGLTVALIRFLPH